MYEKIEGKDSCIFDLISDVFLGIPKKQLNLYPADNKVKYIIDTPDLVHSKENQIVHRLFLVNCYSLHVLFNNAQPASNMGGLLIH